MKTKTRGEDKGKRRLEVEDPVVLGVKPESVSPVKRRTRLPDPNEGLLPPVGREDDSMMSGDEDEDRDDRGRRIKASMRTGRVNESQRVDLSESESEEEEESMEGDFVPAPGHVSISCCSSPYSVLTRVGRSAR